MTPEQEQAVRAIIRDELQNILKADRYVFDKNLQLLDARSIQFGKTNGTMIGTEATQKLGFLGTTPVVKQAAITSPIGGGTAGVDASARTAVVSIIAVLKAFGLTN